MLSLNNGYDNIYAITQFYKHKNGTKYFFQPLEWKWEWEVALKCNDCEYDFR